jgi:hypothetical protein
VCGEESSTSREKGREERALWFQDSKRKNGVVGEVEMCSWLTLKERN